MYCIQLISRFDAVLIHSLIGQEYKLTLSFMGSKSLKTEVLFSHNIIVGSTLDSIV